MFGIEIEIDEYYSILKRSPVDTGTHVWMCDTNHKFSFILLHFLSMATKLNRYIRRQFNGHEKNLRKNQRTYPRLS